MSVRHHGSWVLCLVFATLPATNVATGQARPGAAPPEAASASAAAGTANVGPDTAVITLDGLCGAASSAPARQKSPCRTVITRSEFDGFAEAGGALTPEAKSQFVRIYVQYLLFAGAAQKRGLEKDERFRKMLELSRMQLLTQTLMHDLQTRSEQISPEELGKFYRENPAEFEQADLLRIYIPSAKQVDHGNGVQEPIPGSESEMKIQAEKIHALAIAGEDFPTLQKEALETSNLRTSDEVKLQKMTRERLRANHRGVFDLKPGEVSAMIDEPEGYYVYKMISKNVPPLESVRDQAKTILQKDRMDAWKKNITDSVQITMNEAFFGNNARREAPNDH
jgi:hypothetical protein